MDGGGGGGYSPQFQRQASCSCAPSMSRRYVRGGFNLAGDAAADDDDDDYYYGYLGSGRFDGGHDEKAGDRFGAAATHGARLAPASGRGCGARLKGLWRRILRENKKRVLLCATGCVPATAAAAREPYNAYSYAQNFDDGAAWVEPENLSRSFSARFAVPSRVLQRVAA